VGLCLLVAAADAALITTGGASWYLSLNRPPGTPPSAVFSPAWTALYILMGIAGWLVWRRVGAARPLRLWGWQLLLNALWLPAFFGLRSVALGVVVVVPLLLLIALTIQAFARVKPIAAWLMAPYFACAAYGTYLSIGFWWLNHA
jgi:translocator protein